MTEGKRGHARISWRYPNQWELENYGAEAGITPSSRMLTGIRPVCQEDFPDEYHPELPKLRTLLSEMPYSSYLSTPEWEDRRVAALARAEYRCQLCNRLDELHVHHRTYDSARGEERDADLIVLCVHCHQDHHEREKLRALAQTPGNGNVPL